ncbi:MAG: Omp28-related outer membrane protein [Prevotella sp.]
MKTKVVIFMAALLAWLPAMSGLRAQETIASPVLNVYKLIDQTCIRGMSDNGLWAVAYGVSPSEGSYDFPQLIDVKNSRIIDLKGDDALMTESTVNDVTDDGSMIVGSRNEKPAIWSSEGWKELPLPDGWSAGVVSAVTPDGKWAVGRANNYTNGYKEYPLLWNLEQDPVLVETPGFPQTGTDGVDYEMVRFNGISADARYIVGIVAFSYMNQRLYFLYDRETQQWTAPGFKGNTTSSLTPLADGLLQLDDIRISNNGVYVGATAYMVKPLAGTENYEEYRVPCLYNTSTGEFTIYDDAVSRDLICVVTDDAGTIYAAIPSSTPIRSLYVRRPGYWIALDEILQQNYGLDFYAKSAFENTGSPVAVSADGTTLAAIPSPYDSYILTLGESFGQAAMKVDLLSTYSEQPVSGSAFSKFRSVSVTFNREVCVAGDASAIQLFKADGTLVANAISMVVSSSNSQMVEIGFRTRALDEGQEYLLKIPAGLIQLVDKSSSNKEIVLHYWGRKAEPVSLSSIAPEDGSSVAQVNLTTNPILLTFDTQVLLTDTATAYMYRSNEKEPLCELQMLYNDNQVLMYPLSTQYLYLNTVYRFVVNAGSVTDIMGDNPNNALQFEYLGQFERTIASNDTLIFSETFEQGVSNMLLYEGDNLTPTEEMQKLDFINSTGYPWIPMYDDDMTDCCAASTSSYSPAGRSNDWMVTPQCFIPDEKCWLSFQAQSFRMSKKDSLKVIILATDRVMDYLTDEDIAEFEKDGDVIMNTLLSPGATEGNLAGEWTDFTFPLSAYSGKAVYVAFVNQNEDQSIVFVDNVRIEHHTDLGVGITTSTAVVAQDNISIEGKVVKNSEGTVTYTNPTLLLLDAGNNEIDRISIGTLTLSKGESYAFTFAKDVSLVKGETNRFKVVQAFNEKMPDTIAVNITNLLFKPVKRVVIEEATGQDCGFCPSGILAFEYLEKIYGDKVVPIAYHTYMGDSFESGMTNYATNFLGLTNSPTARINRGDYVSSPMYVTTTNGENNYSFSSPDEDCWTDLVAKEMDIPTSTDLDILAIYNEQNGKIEVPVSAHFALTQEGVNIGLLLVVTEDNLNGYQRNYYASVSDPDLGVWGAGGEHATEYSLFTFDDVARYIVGTSYYGEVGLIPTSVKAGEKYEASLSFNTPSTVADIMNCKVTCMMIDANSGKVINVARAKVATPEGIQSVLPDGQEADAPVQFYTLDGRKLSSLQGARGLIIRKQGSKIQKFLIN